MCQPTDATGLAARGYLLAQEAEHNLLLALVDRASSQAADPTAAFAVAYSNKSVVGVAVSAPARGRLLVLSRMTDDVALALADALAAGPVAVPAVKGPAAASAAFASRWSTLKGLRNVIGVRERILCARTLVPPRPTPGQSLCAAPTHFQVLRSWCDAFFGDIAGRHVPMPDARIRELVDARAFYLRLNADGDPCSMAARVRESANGATIGLVYTPPALRGFGYATNCVAAVCSDVFASRKAYCALYADANNPTSNRLYSSLGFEEVGTTQEFLFELDG
jgi:hypothetical protein